MKYLLLPIVLLTVLFSCKDETKNRQAEVNDPVRLDIEGVSIIRALENPAEANSRLPRLFSDGGQLYFSWVTQKDSVDYLTYAQYSPSGWTRPTVVASGKDWFTNWADFPAIAANQEAIVTNHLQKSADGTYTYDVMLNLFAKPGDFLDRNANSDTIAYIKQNFILHNDGTKSEHGFVSIIPYQDNSFFITWLDGRHTGGSHGTGGAMTLRGAVITATGEIAQRAELDHRVCDCCQTSVAMTGKGPIVAYRDRSDEEIRDISIVRHVDGAWQKPQTLGNDNWKIAGCPVNGPSIDALGNTVAVAWFTVSEGEGDVQVIFSEDAGASFTRAYRIDSGSATGRVDVVMLDEKSKEAAVLWMQPNGEEEAIYLMKINSHGYTGDPVIVSRSTPERASGFPQIERVGDTLVVAWTEVDGKMTHIETATIAVEDL